MIKTLYVFLILSLIIPSTLYGQGNNLWKRRPDLNKLCDPCNGSSLTSHSNWNSIALDSQNVSLGGCLYQIKYKKILCGNVWDIKIVSVKALSGNCELNKTENIKNFCDKVNYIAGMYNEVITRYLYEMLPILNGGTWRLIKPKCVWFENGRMAGSCGDTTQCCSSMISAPKDTCDKWSIIPSESYSSASDIKEECKINPGNGVPCTEHVDTPEGILPRVYFCIPGCLQPNFTR